MEAPEGLADAQGRGDITVTIKEPLNNSASAGQRIFCPTRAGGATRSESKSL